MITSLCLFYLIHASVVKRDRVKRNVSAPAKSWTRQTIAEQLLSSHWLPNVNINARHGWLGVIPQGSSLAPHTYAGASQCAQKCEAHPSCTAATHNCANMCFLARGSVTLRKVAEPCTYSWLTNATKRRFAEQRAQTVRHWLGGQDQMALKNWLSTAAGAAGAAGAATSLSYPPRCSMMMAAESVPWIAEDIEAPSHADSALVCQERCRLLASRDGCNAWAYVAREPPFSSRPHGFQHYFHEGKASGGECRMQRKLIKAKRNQTHARDTAHDAPSIYAGECDGLLSLKPVPAAPALVKRPRNAIVVGVGVFFGRRVNLASLIPALESQLEASGGPVHRVAFLVGKAVTAGRDVAALRRAIAGKEVMQLVLTNATGGNWLPNYVAMVRVFEARTGYDVLVKMDDDVVFLAPGAIAALARAALDSGCGVTSGNVVNHPLLSFIHRRAGAYPLAYNITARSLAAPSLHGGGCDQHVCRTHDYQAWGRCSLRSPACAIQTHQSLLDAFHRVALGDSSSIDAFRMFRRWHFTGDDRWSINLIALPRAWLQWMVDSFGEELAADDELFISGRLHVHLRRPSCAVGDALAAHFSYGPQHVTQELSDRWQIRERFAALQQGVRNNDLRSFAHVHEAFMRSHMAINCTRWPEFERVAPHLRFLCHADGKRTLAYI